jgi:hypothetical protein
LHQPIVPIKVFSILLHFVFAHRSHFMVSTSLMSTESVNESNLQGKLLGIEADLVSQIERDDEIAEAAQKRSEKNRELLHYIRKSRGLMDAQSTGHSKLSHAIKEVIEGLDKILFTAPDIEHALAVQFPTVPVDKPRVRTTLWNMLKRGEIICTRRGSNRSPAVYSRDPKAGGTASAAPRAGVDSLPRRRRAVEAGNGALSK